MSAAVIRCGQLAHTNLGLVELADAPVELQRAVRKPADGAAAGRVGAARPKRRPRREKVRLPELAGGQGRVERVEPLNVLAVDQRARAGVGEGVLLVKAARSAQQRHRCIDEVTLTHARPHAGKVVARCERRALVRR